MGTVCIDLLLHSYHIELCAEPFSSQSFTNIKSSAAIHDAYEVDPAAGPVLICIGHQLMTIGHQELSDIKAHVTGVLTGVDARIVMEYSVLIASVLLVCLFHSYCMCMTLAFILL